MESEFDVLVIVAFALSESIILKSETVRVEIIGGPDVNTRFISLDS